MGSLRDAILSADDLPREQVKTDEWAPFGVPFVYVRALTAKERDDYEMSLTVPGPNGGRVPNPRLKNIRATFAAKVIVEEDRSGKYVRAFDDSDVSKLGNRNAAVLDRIVDKGLELSGMAPVKDDEENPSTGDQDEPSSSDSPTPSDTPMSTDSETD